METKYLIFRAWENLGRKTLIFKVESKSSGAALGFIQWYGAWRQYCFYPEGNTIFNITCLADISNFIRQLMEEKRKEETRCRVLKELTKRSDRPK